MIPRRLKRTTDSQWRTETLAALEANREAMRALSNERRTLIRLARDAGNPLWLIAAATGLSRAHLYRLFPEEAKR